MNRVLFNRQGEIGHNVVHTVIIQPPTCCMSCPGRIECIIIERVYSCHLKVEWYVPRGRKNQTIVVWRQLHMPHHNLQGDQVWNTDNNNGNPVERFATHLDDNFKRLTGLTLVEFEEKLRV